MQIVRRVGLHWLSITRKNRRLMSIEDKWKLRDSDGDGRYAYNQHPGTLQHNKKQYMNKATLYSVHSNTNNTDNTSYVTNRPSWSSPTSVVDRDVRTQQTLRSTRAHERDNVSVSDRGSDNNTNTNTLPLKLQSFGNSFEAPRGLPPPLTAIARGLGSGSG